MINYLKDRIIYKVWIGAHKNAFRNLGRKNSMVLQAYYRISSLVDVKRIREQSFAK